MGREDTYSLPGLGEAANTRVFCREHGVPLRTRFLLEQKGEDTLGEECDNRGDLFSMICHESRQCSGKILGSGEKGKRWMELEICRALWNYSVGGEG